MRRFLSVVIGLATALFVLTVPSAVAGGPTSVLVANFETGRAAAVHYSSTDYTELESILGTDAAPGVASRPAGVSESDNATVRMVWLIHDVTPWRVDNVYVQGKDVWVQTYSDTSGTDPYSATPVWHQPARGADLTKVLTTLGVVGAGTSVTGGEASGVGTVVQEATDPAVAQPATTGAPWWLAATLGALGLALGAIFGARVSPRLHSAPQVAAMG